MKKRLSLALAAGALVAAMLPGAVAAEPAVTEANCHGLLTASGAYVNVGYHLGQEYAGEKPGQLLNEAVELVCSWLYPDPV